MNEPAPHRSPRYAGAPLDPNDASGMVRRDAERCHVLPPKRGVRVMTQGVFDILHLGHLHYFQAARDQGDELVVVIARDETVARNKHQPIFNEDARREMVEALEPVDYAVLGHKGDFYRVVVETTPDVICIGYDQPYKEEAIESECARRGLDVQVVRLEHMDYDLDSTRKVVEAIRERLARAELYTKADPQKDQRRQEGAGVVIRGRQGDGSGRPQTAWPDVETKINEPDRAKETARKVKDEPQDPDPDGDSKGATR